MNIQKLSIGKKLTYSFGILSIIVIAVGIFSYFSSVSLNNSTQVFSKFVVPSIDNASLVRRIAADYRRHELGIFLVSEDKAKVDGYLVKLKELANDMERALNKHKEFINENSERLLLNKINDQWNQYLETSNKAISALEIGQFDVAKSIFLEQGLVKFNDLSSSCVELIGINRAFAKNSEQTAIKTFDSVKVGIAFSIMLAFVAVIFFAKALTKQIRDPLLLILNQSEMIASGNLTRSTLCEYIDRTNMSDSSNEIHLLALAIKRMKENVADIVNDISLAVSQLSSAAEEVSAISEQSAFGMQQQQDEISQLVTAMNEMQNTVYNVSQNTASSADAANEASQSSTSGSNIVYQAIASIENVSEEIEKAGVVVQQLELDSASISVVLDVIRNIADQTNLLALNAAIEAARAGEQGRGFAVVADEVRTLAQRTQDSTSEINKIIEVLQSRAGEAGLVMKSSCEQVKNSVDLARNAGNVIENINQEIIKISDMSLQIASATEEQNSVTEELNRNIVNISDKSNEVAEGATQTAKACMDLGKLAEQLSQVTQRFIV